MSLAPTGGGYAALAAAAGWKKGSSSIWSVPFEDRGRLMDEYLAAFKELWAKDEPSYGVTTINNLRLRGENGHRGGRAHATAGGS